MLRKVLRIEKQLDNAYPNDLKVSDNMENSDNRDLDPDISCVG